MRKTKYNQNTFNRKAPIHREALWGKISSDEKFPKPESKPRKRFWIFGSLGVVLLTSMMIYFFTESAEIENRISDLVTTDVNGSHKNDTQENNTKYDVNQKSLNIDSQLKSMSPPSLEMDDRSNEVNLSQELSADSQSKDEFKTSLSKTSLGRSVETVRTDGQRTLNNSLVITQAPSVRQSQTLESRKHTHQQNFQETIDQKDSYIGFQTIPSLIKPLDDLLLDVTVYDFNLPEVDVSLVPPNSRGGLQAYLNVSYGLSLQSVRLIDSISNNNNDISRFLDNRESRAIEFGVKKAVFKRLRIGVGVEYRQDWQVYNRTNSQILETFIPGDDVMADRFGLAEVTTTYELHQSYKSFNLILTGGYLIPTGIGILEIGGGLNYSINNSSSGNVIFQADNEFILSPRSELYESKNSGFSGFGQVSLDMPLSLRLNLLVNARYNFPSLISSGDTSYEHQLSALRMGVGLGYNF